jgi:hypothetical protein
VDPANLRRRLLLITSTYHIRPKFTNLVVECVSKNLIYYRLDLSLACTYVRTYLSFV